MEECPDSILMGYSKQQIEWCEGNEFSIWQFLINEDLLYTNKQEVIIKYIGPAPFSRGMPRESPARASVWVGYKLLKRIWSVIRTPVFKSLWQFKTLNIY